MSVPPISRIAQSQRQVEDIAGILRLRWESLDRTYIEKWVGELALSAEWQDARRAAGI